MIIKLFDEKKIECIVEKAQGLLSDYRYFFINEKDAFYDQYPSAIWFDDETFEYYVCWGTKKVVLKKSVFNLEKLNDLPLLLNNCFVEDTFDFLTLVIRDSEKCAKDNHIYLYYDDPAAFYLMLCLNDIDKLLQTEKYIFLLGKSSIDEYPLDFKEKFDIDYSSMQPEMLSPDELNRICYFLKGGAAGSDFISHVIAGSDDTIIVRLWALHNGTKLLGERLNDSKKYLEIISDTDFKYETNRVISFFRKNKDIICFSWSGHPKDKDKYPGADAFIDLIEKILCEKYITVVDIFKAYYIVKDYFCRPERAYEYRITPCLIFEPHIPNPDIYAAIFESFKYKVQLSGFRDPLKRLASVLRRKDGSLWGFKNSVKYSVSKKTDYRAIKFEDLKLYPETICKDICEFLKIRYTDNLLNVDYSESSSFGKELIKGYDIKPVVRPVDDVLGLFDQMRLRYYFKEITDHFEYPVFFECALSDKKVEELFRIPFKFFYNFDWGLSEKQFLTIVNDRVRQLDMEKMPLYFKNESIDSYKGALSFNNENYIYSDDTEDIFKILDGFLIYFAQNQDMASFKDKADLDIIESNILKLLALYFERKQSSDEGEIMKRQLFEKASVNIKIDKAQREMSEQNID